jgi:magnesium-transporting ATPase (P-type)
VPADILLLASSHANGACFIETKNIDGETTLKYKRTAKATNDYIQLRGEIQCDEPNPMIYQFNAIYHKNHVETVLFSQDHFVPRGCSIKNIEWVIGLVIYTGHETKIMKNLVNAKSKFSLLET